MQAVKKEAIGKTETLNTDFKAGIVTADGAYDSDKFREKIKQQGSLACIKPRKNRKEEIAFDREQYKERHLIECLVVSIVLCK